MTAAGAPIWLDISRLVRRAARGALSGIDRVEFAYARQLAEIAPDRLTYVMRNPLLGIVALPEPVVRRFLDVVDHAWVHGPNWLCPVESAELFARSSLAGPPRRRGGIRPVYLNVAHGHLLRPGLIADFKRAMQCAFVPLIHDIIPIDLPEYARPGEADKHRMRIKTVADVADGVMASSVSTMRSLKAWLPQDIPTRSVGLGAIPVRDIDGSLFHADPYFICVGTIEPRKNHLLLLHVWRKMAQGLGGSMPRLVIVGRRGWENEMVVDLLERSQSISPFMTEYSSLADAKMSGLLRRARALLMPSFAEGFGLPVAEAIAAGTPVICSDLAAHREAGQGVPEYLDPVDGAAWEAVIRDYACPASPMRAAQMERMRLFVPPGWDSHVRGALDFLDHVAMLPARHVVEENPFLPRPKTTDARTQSVAIARVASRV